jgi:hypothetical protein
MNKGGSFVIFSGVAAAKIAVATMGVAITKAAAGTRARSLALTIDLANTIAFLLPPAGSPAPSGTSAAASWPDAANHPRRPIYGGAAMQATTTQEE